jgi:hypothetical protein
VGNTERNPFSKQQQKPQKANKKIIYWLIKNKTKQNKREMFFQCNLIQA